MSETHPHFLARHKLMTVRDDVFAIAAQIRTHLKPADADALRVILDGQHPADLADAMVFLNSDEERKVFALLDNAESAEVLDEVDPTTLANLLDATAPERLAAILAELPADEGADVVQHLPAARREQVLGLTAPAVARDIQTLLAYPADSAGGIMSLGFIAVLPTATQAEVVHSFCHTARAENIIYIYVVDETGILQGVVDLRQLLMMPPDTHLSTLVSDRFVSVGPMWNQEQVAQVFARYDLSALPVISDDPAGRLLGVITSDDVIDVIQEETAEDVAHLSGSDAQELEKKSPAAVARLRLPWLLGTLGIELIASLVIHFYDQTLAKYLLLASFMPVISAISGNTGLQSAAIIIRGLSTGQVQLNHWKYAVTRQMATTVILGGACSITLGIIGAIWDKHWAFGLVVFLGMFLAINIAGVVGTVVPLLSKRAGFDPALTAGPFETAFQDVVGISIFLSLATVLLHWLR